MLSATPAISATEYQHVAEANKIELEKEIEDLKNSLEIRNIEIENKIATLKQNSEIYSDELKEIKLDQSKLGNYIPALMTLFATFLGAGIAFKTQNHILEKGKRDKQLAAANTVLYILFERLNTIVQFRKDFIEPHRNKPLCHIEMLPLHNFQAPKSELKAEEIAFLFNPKYRELMVDLHVANQYFFITLNDIQLRSSLHFKYQKLIEENGVCSGQSLYETEIIEIIGERNYEALKLATKHLISDVDICVTRNYELRGKLITAFSEIFTKQEIFDFQFSYKQSIDGNMES